MSRPALEYAGPEFTKLSKGVHNDLKKLFKTSAEVFIYAANGHGAWEAALVNTLCPGDTVLVPETGQFSHSWSLMAESLQIKSMYMPGNWRTGIDPQEVEQVLREDTKHKIKAVLMVHTDTATSVTSNVPGVRKAIDAAKHPALFMVDTIASLVNTEYHMDEWGVDVTIAACQKGMMVAPGISFTAANDKAREAGKISTMPRNYWNWQTRRGDIHYTWYCGTGPINSIFGIREALDMIFEETIEGAYKRHQRLADAVRAAVSVWGLGGKFELNALLKEQQANGVTTILIDDAINIEDLHVLCRDKFNVSLGYGLGKLNGKSFRIGHMGYVNEPMVLGALGCIEAAFQMLGYDHGKGGVQAAIESLSIS
jgi:alanine-glyoxylate transaminase/serine-glyoxylate transaminase/serine-pyruvate transaminase